MRCCCKSKYNLGEEPYEGRVAADWLAMSGKPIHLLRDHVQMGCLPREIHHLVLRAVWRRYVLAAVQIVRILRRAT